MECVASRMRGSVECGPVTAHPLATASATKRGALLRAIRLSRRRRRIRRCIDKFKGLLSHNAAMIVTIAVATAAAAIYVRVPFPFLSETELDFVNNCRRGGRFARGDVDCRNLHSSLIFAGIYGLTLEDLKREDMTCGRKREHDCRDFMFRAVLKPHITGFAGSNLKIVVSRRVERVMIIILHSNLTTSLNI